jgi:uncharacterized protein YjbJ (UPF0337 family)
MDPDPPMNPNLTEGNWKQFAGDVKQRLSKMLDKQLDLWSGKRERAKQVAVEQPQQQNEPPK